MGRFQKPSMADFRKGFKKRGPGKPYFVGTAFAKLDERNKELNPRPPSPEPLEETTTLGQGKASAAPKKTARAPKKQTGTRGRKKKDVKKLAGPPSDANFVVPDEGQSKRRKKRSKKKGKTKVSLSVHIAERTAEQEHQEQADDDDDVDGAAEEDAMEVETPERDTRANTMSPEKCIEDDYEDEDAVDEDMDDDVYKGGRTAVTCHMRTRGKRDDERNEIQRAIELSLQDSAMWQGAIRAGNDQDEDVEETTENEELVDDEQATNAMSDEQQALLAAMGVDDGQEEPGTDSEQDIDDDLSTGFWLPYGDVSDSPTACIGLARVPAVLAGDFKAALGQQFAHYSSFWQNRSLKEPIFVCGVAVDDIGAELLTVEDAQKMMRVADGMEVMGKKLKVVFAK